jgi:hypothetical protein
MSLHRIVIGTSDDGLTRRLCLASAILLLQATPSGTSAADDNGPAAGNESKEPTSALEQITILGQYAPQETARKAQEEAPCGYGRRALWRTGPSIRCRHQRVQRSSVFRGGHQGTPDRPIQREFYLPTYQLGARFNY